MNGLNILTKRIGFCGVVMTAMGLGACDPNESLCAKYKQCAEDGEDGFENINDDDDFQGVCSATLKGNDRILLANEEPECDVIVEKSRALNGCLAGLACDDLAEGKECDDERDDYAEAVKDADGECQTSVAGGCSAAAGLPLGLIALGFLFRRRQKRSLRLC